jgi:hypothetical protein
MSGSLNFRTRKLETPKTKAKSVRMKVIPPVKLPHLVKKPRTMPGLSRQVSD